MLTDHDKQATVNRETANEMNREDPMQGHSCLVIALQQLIWRIWRRMCSHIPLKERTQIRKMRLQKWRHKNGSTVFTLTSAKNQKRPILRAEKYGDLITAEHKVLNEEGESRNNHRYAAVVQVLATRWNPCQTKTSQETEKTLRKFLSPSQKPKVIHTYNLQEFGKYCEELSWNRRTTTLHRSDTSGIAERAVRRIKEET